jgi:hypothetical protein
VIGINALRVHAEVIDRVTGPKLDACEQLVGDAVRPMLSPRAFNGSQIEQAVAVGVERPLPDPAACAATDLRHESLSYVSWDRATHPANYTEMIGRRLMQHVQKVAA